LHRLHDSVGFPAADISLRGSDRTSTTRNTFWNSSPYRKRPSQRYRDCYVHPLWDNLGTHRGTGSPGRPRDPRTISQQRFVPPAKSCASHGHENPRRKTGSRSNSTAHWIGARTWIEEEEDHFEKPDELTEPITFIFMSEDNSFGRSTGGNRPRPDPQEVETDNMDETRWSLVTSHEITIASHGADALTANVSLDPKQSLTVPAKRCLCS
jgi:hypothetical protein